MTIIDYSLLLVQFLEFLALFINLFPIIFNKYIIIVHLSKYFSFNVHFHHEISQFYLSYFKETLKITFDGNVQSFSVWCQNVLKRRTVHCYTDYTDCLWTMNFKYRSFKHRAEIFCWSRKQRSQWSIDAYFLWCLVIWAFLTEFHCYFYKKGNF